MAPELEVLRTARGREGSEVAINLSQPGEIDIASMDQRLADLTDTTGGECKYIVINGRLILFFKHFSHEEERQSLRDYFGIMGKPISAGYVLFDPTTSRRQIHGHSTTLIDRLSLEDSDQYKLTTLKECVGNIFDVI